MSDSIYLSLAIVAGISFALIGIAYRKGQEHGIHTMHILAICSPLGAVFFGLRAWHQGLAAIPPIIWLEGLIVGVSQVCLLYSIRATLHRGHLSGLWCALMLGFIPATVYTALVWEEPLAPLNYISILAAVAAILVASTNQIAADDGTGAPVATRPFVYGALLLATLLLNSCSLISLKDLNMRAVADVRTATSDRHDSVFSHFGNVYFFVLYACLVVGIITDQLVSRRSLPQIRKWLPLGLLAAFGSILGMSLAGVCAFLPAAQVFTVSSVSSILAGALFSTFLFGEARNWKWYTSVACCCLAVLLAYLA